ncbi:schwannomin-interacting protein 1 homolog isoform X1 [Drosophila miranda]|uniref:schwannomin-interacting protein 1 homolog isoform X1 n=2 Tax=Drosophila miranda TaxID=7229 RepID=UPI00143F2CB7|nr:schwannomin-interacting protein 1 homolog isoform X1 [Drosophila miranda]
MNKTQTSPECRLEKFTDLKYENIQGLVFGNSRKNSDSCSFLEKNSILFEMSSIIMPNIVNETGKTLSEKSKELLNKPELVYSIRKNYMNKINYSHRPCKIDQLPGPSEIDIVGDFGEEVEREIDLLFTGFKSKKLVESLHVLNLSKICDAELSNGGEALRNGNLIPYSEENSRKMKVKNSTCGQELTKIKSRKSSHDDRQLPLDKFDYKKCNQQKYIISETETYLAEITKNLNNMDIPNLKNQRHRPSAEDIQIQRSRQYVEHPIKYKNDHSSPIVLEQFDAYKVAFDMDLETLKNHFKMAHKIELKRRYNRDEICKRLAFKGENIFNNIKSLELKKDVCSDTESYSSDSETCPKLTSGVLRRPSILYATKYSKDYTNHKMSHNSNNKHKSVLTSNENIKKTQERQTNEKVFFFTKQSKLQIEVRLALAQSRKIAQRKIKSQNHGVTHIVDIIRTMLHNVGLNMDSNHRWISRQLLTGVNLTTLQLLVDNFQAIIEKLNVHLLESLKERDDLNLAQDAILHDLEKINNFLNSTSAPHINSRDSDTPTDF